MPTMKQASFLNRLRPQSNSPLLPLHENRHYSEDYYLDELEPEPTDALLTDDSATHRQDHFGRGSPPDDIWKEMTSHPRSSPQLHPGHVFDGPPPPIAASVMLPRHTSSASPPRSRDILSGKKAFNGGSGKRPGQVAFSHVLFDPTTQHRGIGARPSDSVWKLFQRREKAISKDLQNLLDMQASGLVAGSSSVPSSATSDADPFSDDGSTPTATFYSAVTSKSRMLASLDNPIRATPRGDVIPVRQPKRSKHTGLRTARDGLRRSMRTLAHLKAEEDAEIDAALSERRQALSHLRKLGVRQDSITSELRVLADDGEEPLAKELRDLSGQHAALDKEITELEERLVGMRNRRRWLGRKMDDVKNRREAGLSGYRGALREVEGELSSLMRRPPFEPLDLDTLGPSAEDPDNTGQNPDDLPTSGEEFLQLIPERRTADLALDWWQGEVTLLEARKNQIGKDREALEAGLELWQQCTTIVTKFEAGLSQAMKGKDAEGYKGKGKARAPSPEEILQSQLAGLEEAIEQLETYWESAKANGWNLLICSIGAELEAFEEAQRMLRGMLGSSVEPSQASEQAPPPEPQEVAATPERKPSLSPSQSPAKGKPTDGPRDELDNAEESDNEVPPDLLVSQVDHRLPQRQPPSSLSEREESSPALLQPDRRRDSNSSDNDNVPPPEFLAEHDPEDEVFSREIREG